MNITKIHCSLTTPFESWTKFLPFSLLLSGMHPRSLLSFSCLIHHGFTSCPMYSRFASSLVVILQSCLVAPAYSLILFLTPLLILSHLIHRCSFPVRYHTYHSVLFKLLSGALMFSFIIFLILSSVSFHIWFITTLTPSSTCSCWTYLLLFGHLSSGTRMLWFLDVRVFVIHSSLKHGQTTGNTMKKTESMCLGKKSSSSSSSMTSVRREWLRMLLD